MESISGLSSAAEGAAMIFALVYSESKFKSFAVVLFDTK